MKMKMYKHKETEFQRLFVKDNETILQIVELVFPDVDWSKERGNIEVVPHRNYTWISIKYKGKEFFIDNHVAYIDGIGVTGKVTPNIYKKIDFEFNLITCNSIGFRVSDEISKRIRELLSKKYKKPSFDEWWNEYHVE